MRLQKLCELSTWPRRLPACLPAHKWRISAYPRHVLVDRAGCRQRRRQKPKLWQRLGATGRGLWTRWINSWLATPLLVKPKGGPRRRRR
jgi:hypothetical protein